jgi:hypothetical protein
MLFTTTLRRFIPTLEAGAPDYQPYRGAGMLVLIMSATIFHVPSG